MVGLLETRGCGPASWIFSGRFFWSNRGLAWRKASQCGITTATDIERHVCGGDYKRQRKGIIAKSNHLPLYRFIKRLAFHLGRQKVAHFWEVLLHPLLYLLNSTPWNVSWDMGSGDYKYSCFYERSVKPKTTLRNSTMESLAWLDSICAEIHYCRYIIHTVLAGEITQTAIKIYILYKSTCEKKIRCDYLIPCLVEPL